MLTAIKYCLVLSCRHFTQAKPQFMITLWCLSIISSHSLIRRITGHRRWGANRFTQGKRWSSSSTATGAAASAARGQQHPTDRLVCNSSISSAAIKNVERDNDTQSKMRSLSGAECGSSKRALHRGRKRLVSYGEFVADLRDQLASWWFATAIHLIRAVNMLGHCQWSGGKRRSFCKYLLHVRNRRRKGRQW